MKKIILYIPKNITIIFLAVLLTKLHLFMINWASQVFFTEKKEVNIFIAGIIKEYDYCKKKMLKKHFNKNLVMSAKD